MPHQGELNQILMRALRTGADFSEIYLEDRFDVTARCVEGRIKDVTSLHIHGAGIYILKGNRSVYVHTNDTSLNGLIDLADKAAEILPFSAVNSLKKNIPFIEQKTENPVPAEIHPRGIDTIKKLRVIREMDKAARGAGTVRNLKVVYFDSCQNIKIANSEGLLAEDERIRSRVRLDLTVEKDNEYLFEFNDFAGPCGFELFNEDYSGFARNCVASMTARLTARPLASCVVPVVIEGGSGGVLWHEACGHSLESDNVITGRGEFGGKIGLKVASEKVTLIDDGSIPGMYGSEGIDDEGYPTRRNLLIEKGILKGYLCDRKGARILGTKPTGRGRRGGYSFAPAARMHNTFLAAGSDDEEEMIRTMGDGLFVKDFGGGNSGVDFSIEAKEAYWVKAGEISHQVKGITLSGNSLEIIGRVDRVGKKLVQEKGGSFCGGPSGLLPTTAFQPRIRISEMSVGGMG